jgi:hypothetical protein
MRRIDDELVQCSCFLVGNNFECASLINTTIVANNMSARYICKMTYSSEANEPSQAFKFIHYCSSQIDE